jgi:uncharacterized protein with GYD domain
MATYVMFGNYSSESLRGISEQRTREAVKLINEAKGKLVSGYALLGDIDLILVVEFPNMEAAMKASVNLSKLTGISFETSAALPINKFDDLFV